MRYTGSTVESVGRKFAELLRRDLTPEQLRELIRRNRTRGPKDGWCASHDFLDSNMTMLEAMASVLAMSEDAVTDLMEERDDERDLWNAAWPLGTTFLDKDGV